MANTRTAHRTKWTSAGVLGTEAVFVAAFVIAVYMLVVYGGNALWPDLSSGWSTVLWIFAAAVSAFGLNTVRAYARTVARRILPADADPYTTLVSFASDVVAVESVDDALPRLAALAAEGTGARRATVWLVTPDGLRQVGEWPPADGTAPPEGSAEAADLAELDARPDVDHLVPVRDAGGTLGALTLTGTDGGFLTPRDLRLASDVANAAGMLLRNADLTERLRERVRRETAQAEELRASRQRVVLARDAARERLGREIQVAVCEPLERAARDADRLREELAARDEDAEEAEDEQVDDAEDADEDDETDGAEEAAGAPAVTAELADLTGRIDAAIKEFRAIVHGVFPPALTDHGLVAALENLVAGLRRDANLSVAGLPREPPRVESGVYFCVATLLRSLATDAKLAPLEVVVRLDVDELLVTVRDSASAQVGEEVMEAVRDRVAALDGRVAVETGDTGTVITLTIPVDAAVPLTRDILPVTREVRP